MKSAGIACAMPLAVAAHLYLRHMSQKPCYRIAVYPGDGIGQEVTPLAFDVLRAAIGERVELDCTEFPWGVDYFLEHGSPTAPDYIEQLRPFDAIYLGAVGAPNQMPDPVSLEPPVRIRQAFDQYACLRPALLLNGVRSPLAGMEPRAIDLLVVRENSEGEYVNQGGRFRRGEPDEIAVQSAIHTRAGVTRILRFALEQARARRRHLTMVTKSNAQKYSFVLWEEVLEDLIPEYPDVRTDRLYVDAAAMDLVRRPRDFDVIVSSNLFGDILSDLAAMVVGGLGMAPSANIRPDRGAPSMFEPVHGSAPDIAGKGIANPTAAILSAAMMIEWLGHAEPAERMRAACEQALAGGAGTPDIGGALSSAQFAERVTERLAG